MSADVDAPRSTPSLRDVARALDVDRRRLRHFVDYHPDPSAANVLGAFRAPPEHRELVARWLEGRDATPGRGGERR